MGHVMRLAERYGGRRIGGTGRVRRENILWMEGWMDGSVYE
jgi:hypothetical protein